MIGNERDPQIITGEQEPLIIDLRDQEVSGAEISQGVAYLKELYPDDTDTQAANYALALLVALKHSDSAMRTGSDVNILGVPSQQLLRDVLFRMPLGVQEPDPAGEKLFEEFIKDIGTTTPEYFKALVVDYLRFLNNYWHYFEENTDIENKALRENNQPVQTEIRYLAEYFLDRVLKEMELSHEGGNLDKFEPELFRELCEPLYLRMVFQSNSDQPQRSGLRGQTVFRLMLEARNLNIPGAHETTLQ